VNCPVNCNGSPKYRVIEIARSVLETPILGHVQATGQKANMTSMHGALFTVCCIPEG
jgi:hypothetical protein